MYHLLLKLWMTALKSSGDRTVCLDPVGIVDITPVTSIASAFALIRASDTLRCSNGTYNTLPFFPVKVHV